MNKLVICKSCGKEVAKGAKCPNCGYDQRNFFVKHKVITVILAIAIIGGFSSAMGGNKETTTANTGTTTTAVQPVAQPVTPVATPKPTVPTEYISALAKAEAYGTTMSMSKTGIYDQLTSENGEKFSKESAQYAVDNVKIDYNANALKKARTYQKEMSMSPSAVYDQLISENGEKFTPAQAKYAKDNLK